MFLVQHEREGSRFEEVPRQNMPGVTASGQMLGLVPPNPIVCSTAVPSFLQILVGVLTCALSFGCVLACLWCLSDCISAASFDWGWSVHAHVLIQDIVVCTADNHSSWGTPPLGVGYGADTVGQLAEQ